PTIVQVVRGEAPAKGPPVRLAGRPGADFAYSNGGYHTVQIAIEDATGMPFAALARRDILDPLGMSRSSFMQPSALAARATGHHELRPFAAKAWWVSELAAGGLWTTPGDLARFLIAMRRAADGEGGAILSPDGARAMLRAGKENWGLGFEIDGARFGHGGVFWGMMSRMWIDRASGDGIVVMANDFQGMALTEAIIRSAAVRYGWSDLAPRSFAAARDAGTLYLRGSINDWGTASPFLPAGDARYAVTITVTAPGEIAFKVASADWKTFVLGTSAGAPVLGKRHALDPDGDDIRLVLPGAGRYRVVLDAPDTGAARLRIDPA
ncbi:serine hydrolase, partial [Sphingomonas sp. CCH15-F11]|uniref:serine hydrolase n=1 Tax=Sphingomonas sp. CCH15-F11 TaxID=1768785 RepID=UPI000A79B846